MARCGTTETALSSLLECGARDGTAAQHGGQHVRLGVRETPVVAAAAEPSERCGGGDRRDDRHGGHDTSVGTTAH